MRNTRLLGLAGRFGRGVATGVAAGVAAGLVCGVLGRMVMRFVALAAGMPPTWSTLASLHLLLMTSLYSIPLALLYVAVRRWVPGRGPRRGALFGFVMLLLLVYPAIITELHFVIGDLGLGPSLLGATLVSSLFIVNGIALETIVSALRRERQPAPVAA